MQRLLTLFFFLILALAFFLPQPASAHIAGQPPFFLMNDRYADYYPIYSTSLKDFTLPQDIAPENYLVNEPITFEIDTQMLPFPPEVTEQITFSWDFGDGTTGEGTKNTHTYTKIGSYLLTINADYGDYSDPNTKPVIQAVLLHVLPNRDYKLPKAAIVLNQKKVADPLLDTFTVPTGEKISFATSVEQGSTPITSYFWDLGDGTTSDKESLTYTYEADDSAYLFPFLRVTDKNGFFVDTYAQIENATDAPSNSWFRNNSLLLLIGVNLLILVGGGFFLFRKSN